MAPGLTSPTLAQHRPTWAEVDLDALEANLAAVRAHLGPTQVLAVVKANAYGHGAVEVSRVLEQKGVDCLGVALPEEGLELRCAGIGSPIVVLGGFAPAQADLLLEHQLTPALFRADQIEALSAAAERRGSRAPAHLKIDTGMGRLGVPLREVGAFAARLAASPRIDLNGVFSHLAVAEEPSDPFTREQIDLFRSAVDSLRGAGLMPASIHLANSAAVLDHAPARLTMVRPGLVLYGYHPSELVTRLPLRPVLSLMSRIIYLKDVPAGTSVGYGRTYVTARASRIASLALGYDDGLPRLVGNRGYVLVHGRQAPIIGRVSMDLTTIDVTGIPRTALGDTAVVLGRSGAEELSADRIASWAETISWEVLCGIGQRVPRLYLRGGDRRLVSHFRAPLADRGGEGI